MTWLGGNNGNRHLDIAQRGLWFGPACPDPHRAQCLEKLFPIVASGYDVEQGSYAYAREEDDQVVVALHQAIGKLERLPMRFQGRFAHGRHHERLTTVSAYQLGDFFGTTRLERQHS